VSRADRAKTAAANVAPNDASADEHELSGDEELYEPHGRAQRTFGVAENEVHFESLESLSRQHLLMENQRATKRESTSTMELTADPDGNSEANDSVSS
jgi:hypothetical protein